MEESTERSRISLYVVMLAAVILLGYGFYYSRYGRQNQTMNDFNQRYQSVETAHDSGDFSGTIDGITPLLNNAPDKGWEAKLKSVLAYSLFARNQNDDRAQAIKLYKEVVNDPNVPARARALVLIDLVSTIEGQTESFYKEYFPEPPFNSYLPTKEGDKFAMSKAMTKMLQYSDQIYPTSLAKYYIAYNYGGFLVNNGLNADMKPEVAAKLIQNYVQSADPLIGDVTYEPSRIVQQYLFRAIALNGSSLILKNVSVEDGIQNFQLTLTKAAPYERDDFKVHFIAMDTRFFYATFLLRRLGESRASDIREILKPFGEAAKDQSVYNQAVRNRFSSLKTVPENNYVKMYALKLAPISPDFKGFLISVGLLSS